MQTQTQERKIAMPWLARLRWLAVIGQIGATAIGVMWLQLSLPLGWMALVILITAATNLALQIWDRVESPPGWIVPAVLLLDVCMLTVLLYFTGGTDNPFVVLYIIHAAMAVAVLGSGWSWVIVAVSVISFAGLFFFNRPLYPHLPEQVQDLGKWCALALVMVLIVYFVGRVVDALRRREQELTEARERAGRHEHLAALTTLAAGAAHELGTPLSTIALAAKEMEHSVDPASPLAEDARLIRHEVDRCRAILDRMRVDVIEDSAQRPSFETLGELLEELHNDLAPQEKPRLQVKTEEPGDEVVYRSRVLRMAIGVLLRNAFDASSPEAPVQLLFQRNKGSMIFEVLDDGQGMSEDVLRRAGEPFFTTKAPGAGMGLGLFLVRLVAETYGGRFELKSTPGHGTRSILEVPDPSAIGKSDDAPEIEDAGGGRRRDLPDPAGASADQPRL